MSGGFNTNVRVGERVFHVQTEDRGPSHSKIDTAVYLKGRVLHHHSSKYPDLRDSADLGKESVRLRVEEQHRQIVEALRDGSLPLEAFRDTGHSGGAADAGPGISVSLLNAGAWISAGHGDLMIEVRSHDENATPIEGARVEACLEGIADASPQEAASDAEGRVRLRFPLPSSGIAGATLAISASSDSGRDEIRFALRPKSKPPAGNS
ncbi:MAG: hypothetical protein WA755_04335 [Candidatus Acidiferrales bacterium]